MVNLKSDERDSRGRFEIKKLDFFWELRWKKEVSSTFQKFLKLHKTLGKP